MKRIDSINARPNVNGTGKTGFHDNADLSGQDATYLTPDFMNHLQEELCNLLEMNGVALNSNARDQLYQLLATNADIDALAAATQVKLDQEQQWRTNADNNLQQLIWQVDGWRADADAGLQQQINNEQTARINAISQEQTWRENADADLENRKFDKAGGTVAGDVTINGILTVLANIAALTLKSNVGGTEIETLFGKLTLTNIPNGGGISQVFNTTADLYQFDKPIFAPNLNPIGVGQTWVDLTDSRAFDTDYTNNTGRPIMVNAAPKGYEVTGSEKIAAYVDGVLVYAVQGATSGANHYQTYNVSFIVPAGATYRIVGLNRALFHWAELR